MNWQLIIGSGGLVGIGAIIFYLGRIVARFEAKFDSNDKSLGVMDKKMEDNFKGIDKRIVSQFESIEKRFDSIEKRFDKIDSELNVIKSRLDRLEVRVEERTLKVFHVQKGSEKILENV